MFDLEIKPKDDKGNTNLFLKFLVPSLFGIIMFLMPVPYDGAVSTPIGIISEIIEGILAGALNTIVTYVVAISALLSLVDYLFKPRVIRDVSFLKSLFSDKLLFVILRILGAATILIIYNEWLSEVIYGSDTGGEMMFLVSILVIRFMVASLVIPYLVDFGAMEFIGTLIRGIIKPLFTIPGRSAIDLTTSWIGNNNVGVVITREQYNSGFYTGREAAVITTCFSAVSLPFCLVIASILGLDGIFVTFYLTVVVVGLLSVVIMSRIPPLSTLPDTYHPKAGKQINEQAPEGTNKLKWATEKALEKAATGDNLKGLTKRGIEIWFGIIIKLLPLVILIGTFSLIIASYTDIMDWLSLPFAYYLQFLGVPEAFAVAPATVVGFLDMFIPAILGASIEAIEARFLIGVLSLVQIIYMTEIGVLIIMSDIPLDFKNLLIIFLEKTIIAIPLIVLASKIIF